MRIGNIIEYSYRNVTAPKKGRKVDSGISVI